MNKKLTVYLDMDGVLCNFDKAVNQMGGIDNLPWLNSKNFFRNLEPIGNPNNTIKLLQQLGYNVYILSKVEVRDIEGQQRAIDKVEWVKEHIPSLPIENVIIVPYHLNKTDYLKSDIKTSVLLDDYKENLIEWSRLGGYAVKFGNKFKPSRNYYQIKLDIFNLVPMVESFENSLK